MRAAVDQIPRYAIVLGSGLRRVVEGLDDPVEVPFSAVPGLPEATVHGHDGRILFGYLSNVPVILCDGRLHAYEGYHVEQIVKPMRLLVRLGVETVLITNAAGAVNPALEVGDIVLIGDQINFTFRSALAGPSRKGEDRFPDMSVPFDAEIQEVVCRVARRIGVPLRRGTYAGVLGPSFETAAEVRMLALMHADVVGMSTVSEVVVARAAGLRVGALSLVTNKATGLSTSVLSHNDALALGSDTADRMLRLLSEVVLDLANLPKVK